MNDSFLEDLELVSSDAKNVSNYPVDRHITTRAATSSPLEHLQQKGETLQHKIEQSAINERQAGARELNAKDLKKLSEHDVRKQQMNVNINDRREKPAESKLKPIENKVKSSGKEHDIKEDIKAKLRETRVKISENKALAKERARRSGSYKENNQASGVSTKENKPAEVSKESISHVEVSKDKGKSCDCSKKTESKDTDPVALLNAIKDIVSMCTKQENTKILRSMQELHINSQANLIKHLMSQTDDLINEMHPSKDSSRMKSLTEQNERLREDIAILQRRNEDLQKKMEEFEFLKQENIALKIKCKELSKQ